MTTHINDKSFKVASESVEYTPTEIVTQYSYQTSKYDAETNTITPKSEILDIKTDRSVPKLGVMLVGLGGNNGSTLVGGILANSKKITWETKEGTQESNYYGSLTQASTIRIATEETTGEGVFIPFKHILPMVEPDDLVIGGWDISSMNLAQAMKRAQVLDIHLQQKLEPMMKDIVPLPSIYCPDFIAANQADRADNVLTGTKAEMMDVVRKDIRTFKSDNDLDKVIVLWTANTERFSDVKEGLNDSAESLMRSIVDNKDEVSPSTLFAVASILEGCSYINGSPQNTFVPGVMELAQTKKVFIGGDDFKSGQTKMKSVLVDFLVSAGIKPTSIVSYNHLGNNDGKNLSAPQQFRSKEISKSNVVDDMVDSNRMLYAEGEHPDHCVVIKYVPAVKDSKRALDEYTSKIFMNGTNTISMHNTCEDSLLASPLILDLVIICELAERITIKKQGDPEAEFERLHSVLSILSYMLKAPLVPKGTPVVNALFAQRECMINLFRACIGLPAENHMLLENKLISSLKSRKRVPGGSVHQGVFA